MCIRFSNVFDVSEGALGVLVLYESRWIWDESGSNLDESEMNLDGSGLVGAGSPNKLTHVVTVVPRFRGFHRFHRFLGSEGSIGTKV